METLKVLEQISGPTAVVQALANKRQYSKIMSYLEQLLETGTAYFWHNRDIETSYHHERVAPAYKDDFTPESSEKFREVVLVWTLESGLIEFKEQYRATPELAAFNLAALCDSSQEVSEQVRQLVRRVLQKSVERPAEALPQQVIDGTNIMFRYFYQKGEHRNLIELWLMQVKLRSCELATDEMFKFTLWRVLESVPKSKDKLPLSERFNSCVDHLASLGMPQEEIKQLVLELIRRHGPVLGPQLVMLSGCKVFAEHDESRHQLLNSFFRDIWNEFIQHDHQSEYAKWFRQLLIFGMGNTYQNQELFTQGLVNLMAAGQVDLARQIFLLFGDRLERYASISGFRSEAERREKSTETITDLAGQAFETAFNKGRFGIAAALAQHFEDDGLYDDLPSKATEWLSPKVRDLMEVEDPTFNMTIEWWLERTPRRGSGRGLYPRNEEISSLQEKGLKALKVEWNEYLEQLKAERAEKASQAIKLALDLRQKIKLELFTYLQVTTWPDTRSA